MKNSVLCILFLCFLALDSYCLIEIYDVIGEQMTKIGEDFNEVINNFLTEKKRKNVLKKTKTSERTDPQYKNMESM